MKRIWFCILIAVFCLSASAKLSPKDFPVDDAMRIRVDFWKKVYTEITSQQGFIHDSENLDAIYETVTHTNKSRRARKRYVRGKKRAIRSTLRSIIKKDKVDLSDEEKSVLKNIGDPPVKQLKKMVHRVRYQRGMRDRYYEGLVRSSLYLDRIKEIFVGQGLPEALAYLPHVESSFNYAAYSKVGAAGIWQFMRGTGRQYKLRITYVIDERRDPILATKAAAKLLRDNYRRLKTWPLALTAYNHGPASMARAVRRVNSTDMSKIIEKYDGRRFGFASKNFYASFVATAEISDDPKKYFPKVTLSKPVKYSEIKLPKPLTIAQISSVTGLNKSVLREYNQAIRSSAFRTQHLIPKGYRLKLPHQSIAKLQEHQRKIAAIEYVAPQIRAGGTHRVSRGENLYFIAKLYKVSLGDIVALNELTSPSRIYPGMKLQIPGEKGAVNKKLAKNAKKKAAKPAPTEVVVPAPSQDDPTLIAKMEKLFSEMKKNYSEFKGAKKEEKKAEADIRGIDMANYDLEVQKIKPNLYWVTVESEETLGHLADWAAVNISTVRKLNALGRRSNIHDGQKLKFPIAENNVPVFLLKRIEYHAAIEEDFYENYRVTGTTRYLIRRGDTIGRLSKKFDAPHWLIKKVQPSGRNAQLQAGQFLYIPEVESITIQENALKESES